MFATAGFLVSSAIIVGAQFAFAHHLDRTLPKRKKLPLWLRGGPHMDKRRWALIAWPCLNAFLAVLLLITTLTQDFDPGPRTDVEMIVAGTLVLLLFALLNLANIWRLKRWFRKGEPKID